MEIVYSLPHVFSTSSSQEEDAAVLQQLLENLIAIDRIFIRFHRGVPGIYSSGVTYGRTKTWDTIPEIVKKRKGDCKSLVAWRIAELREAGIKCRPVFRFRKRPDGGKDFHILILFAGRSGEAAWEDPSRKLGMGRNENARMQ